MKVELISSMGDDNMVADCARVSYLKNAENYSSESNEKLLKYLATHNHWSPFSHPQLQFRITVPIYVERQLVKTEAGRVYNSVSGRYVDFSDTYTIIDEWRKQSTNSKQGSEGLVDNQLACKHIQQRVLDTCREAYEMLLTLGVAKEQARTILPLNLNTTMIYTCSLYTFIRLYHQRIKPEAQVEIQNLVKLMLAEVKTTGKFNTSLQCYGL